MLSRYYTSVSPRCFRPFFNLGFLLNLLRLIFTLFFTAISRILELMTTISRVFLFLSDHAITDYFINLQILGQNFRFPLQISMIKKKKKRKQTVILLIQLYSRYLICNQLATNNGTHFYSCEKKTNDKLEKPEST